MFIDADRVGNIQVDNWVEVTVYRNIGCKREMDNCPWFHALKGYGILQIGTYSSTFLLNGDRVERGNTPTMCAWIKAYDNCTINDMPNSSILINTRTLEMEDI